LGYNSAVKETLIEGLTKIARVRDYLLTGLHVKKQEASKHFPSNKQPRGVENGASQKVVFLEYISYLDTSFI
jgi:hypothetical protein